MWKLPIYALVLIGLALIAWNLNFQGGSLRTYLRCKRCGYPHEGLARGAACPECGGLKWVPGRTKGEIAQRVYGRVIAVTLVTFAIWIAFGPGRSEWLPVPREYNWTAVIEEPLLPPGVTIHAIGRASLWRLGEWDSSIMIGSRTERSTPEPTETEFTVKTRKKLITFTVRRNAKTLEPPSIVIDDTVSAYSDAALIDHLRMSDPELRPVISEALKNGVRLLVLEKWSGPVIRNAVDGALWPTIIRGSSSRVAVPKWVDPFIGVVLVALWTLSVWHIWRRRALG